MAVRLVNNYLTDKDIELLKLEEKKRELYNRIKNDTDLGQDEKQKLFKWYKQLRDEIKEIAYMSTGLFNDAEYGHLLKGNKLNLGLLQKWKVMNVEELTTEELAEELNDILKEKEFAVFTKIHEDKSHEEIANELDITKEYSYCLLSEGRRKIKDLYDLDKVAEMLEETNVSSSEFEEVKKDQEATPEEQPREDDQDKPKGIFINFDDEATEGDVDEITGLITRIKGVSHISENNPKVEELKSKISSLMNKF